MICNYFFLSFLLLSLISAAITALVPTEPNLSQPLTLSEQPKLKVIFLFFQLQLFPFIHYFALVRFNLSLSISF